MSDVLHGLMYVVGIGMGLMLSGACLAFGWHLGTDYYDVVDRIFEPLRRWVRRRKL